MKPKKSNSNPNIEKINTMPDLMDCFFKDGTRLAEIAHTNIYLYMTEVKKYFEQAENIGFANGVGAIKNINKAKKEN